MNEIVLRPDQSKIIYETYENWNSGNRNVLIQQPTGGGKSVIMSSIVKQKSDLGYNQVVIAHRTELVSQMSMHIARRKIKHRIIGPKNVISQINREHRNEFNGYSFINPDAKCAVGGVDTIVSRKEELSAWAQQQNFWFIDEAHHVLAHNKWGTAASLFTNAFGLGVTGTSERADGQGLGAHADGLFNALVIGPTTRELINIGALCDYEIVIPKSDFEVPKDVGPSGDYSPKKLREASKKSHIVGDVVIEYIKFAAGKKAICFATDVETANNIANNFNDFGIRAVAISAKTPSEVRSQYIRQFRQGLITVLVNVDLFGEGFDVPDVEVAIMARPTASLAVYLQQFGRVLRVMANKPFGLVIDHVSNWKRHGFPDKPKLWTLDRRDKRAKKIKDPENIELVACLNCSKPYEQFHVACPHCGHVPEITPIQRRSIEQIDGDLTLLDRNKLEELRKAIEFPTPADVGERTRFVAGEWAAKAQVEKSIERHQSQQRLSNAIALWAAIQRSKGRSDQESYRRFYLTIGFDVLTCLAQPKKEMDMFSDQIEKWNLQYGYS